MKYANIVKSKLLQKGFQSLIHFGNRLRRRSNSVETSATKTTDNLLGDTFYFDEQNDWIKISDLSVTIDPPDNFTINTTTLPSISTNAVLISNGTGTLSWDSYGNYVEDFTVRGETIRLTKDEFTAIITGELEERMMREEAPVVKEAHEKYRMVVRLCRPPDEEESDE